MFKKFNWGHGIAIALGSFMAFILFMILIFPNGKQEAELVTDHYYNEELLYQSVIDSKKNAAQLPVKPIYNQNAKGISITFANEIMPDQKKVSINLFRTNDATLDVVKDLTLDQKKTLLIPANVIAKGSYTLKVKWAKNKKPYQLDYDVEWK